MHHLERLMTIVHWGSGGRSSVSTCFVAGITLSPRFLRGGTQLPRKVTGCYALSGEWVLFGASAGILHGSTWLWRSKHQLLLDWLGVLRGHGILSTSSASRAGRSSTLLSGLDAASLVQSQQYEATQHQGSYEYTSDNGAHRSICSCCSNDCHWDNKTK